MTEKRKPTYDIEAVKTVFSTVEKLNVTGSALKGAASLGFGRSDIVATIQTIERRHFYKSMTSFADHRGRMPTTFRWNRGLCTSSSRPMP